MPRLAWFSPMPPARSGIAVYSRDVVAALRHGHEIDVFADEPSARAARAGGHAGAVRSAHDFIWEHQQRPYDLTIFQLGNSSAHDFLWPYLFRYPGLAVLHDAQLHHARAAALLRQKETEAYRAEFAASDPAAHPDLAELAIKGFDSHLYYNWPMTRLIVEASRVTAVHAHLMAPMLGQASPGAVITWIRLGHGSPPDPVRARQGRQATRERYGIPESSLLFGVFGGLSPEKRVPQILRAFAALLPYQPGARLLLAGAPARHYDVAADVRGLALEDAVTVTGYLESDEAFDEAVAACDVSLNLRWPTAREVSGPWLRALAAAKPTITLDLAHAADVPSLDPRTWTPRHTAASAHLAPEPVTVAIDILDEEHSLRLAMRRLGSDAGLRDRLGAAAARYWDEHHSIAGMLEDYERVIRLALAAPAGAAQLPAHLRTCGGDRLEKLLAPFELPANLWGTI